MNDALLIVCGLALQVFFIVFVGCTSILMIRGTVYILNRKFWDNIE